MMKLKFRVIEEIRSDIDKGIYSQFPELKDRLTYICNKLFNSCYVINSDMKLTEGEIKTLIENEYINIYENPDLI